MRRGVLAAVAAVGVASALALSSCSAGPAVEPAAEPRLPDGVSVSVYQSRSDVAAHRLKVSVTNDGARPLRVTAARFAAPQFAGPAVWAKDGTTVRPGTTADLPVALPAPDCTADGPPTVTLGFLDEDGAEAEVTVPPVDRFDRLPALRAEDCLAEAVAAVARLSLPGPVVVADLGGTPVAHLDVRIEPTGRAGSVTLDSVAGTTLLAIADPSTGARTTAEPLARTVDGAAGPSTHELTLVPNRCDPHAIAEDKRGTILPVHVTTADGTAGVVPVPAGDAVRSELYAFVARSCGLP